MPKSLGSLFAMGFVRLGQQSESNEVPVVPPTTVSQEVTESDQVVGSSSQESQSCSN